MSRSIHRLLAAAAVTALLAAAPARADRDHDREAAGERHSAPPGPVYAPGPRGAVVVPAPAVAMSFPYRRAHWRPAYARQDLRREYHQLDLTRARFYAAWDGRPWERDRFEGWYAARRSELDQRWAELERWNGRDRW